jgi:hypothetical protein
MRLSSNIDRQRKTRELLRLKPRVLPTHYGLAGGVGADREAFKAGAGNPECRFAVPDNERAASPSPKRWQARTWLRGDAIVSPDDRRRTNAAT